MLTSHVCALKQQQCRACNKPLGPTSSAVSSSPAAGSQTADSEGYPEDAALPFPEWALAADVELEKSNILLLVCFRSTPCPSSPQCLGLLTYPAFIPCA